MKTQNLTQRLDTLDQIIKSAQEAAHRLHNAEARLLAEYALAHLRESWIAESGQAARTPPKVHEDVAKGLRMLELILESQKPAGSQLE